MKRKDKYFLSVLLIIYSVIKIVVLLKPFSEINGFAIPDDAYLSLDIARNFANGKWFFCGQGTTSGFQPLYVFLMVPVFWLFKADIITPVYVSIIMLNIFGFWTIYFLYKTIRKIFDDDYSPFISVMLFILLPVTVVNTGNGLETSIAFFFFTLVFYYLYSYDFAEIKDISYKKIFLFGALVGLSLLARIDNVMLTAGIIVWIFLKGKILNSVKPILIFTAGLTLVYLPYLALSYYFTGDIFPISGKAVHQIGSDSVNNYTAGGSNLFELLKLSIRNIYTNYSIIILYALVGTFLFRIKTLACPWFKGGVKRHLPIIITSVLIFSAYTFYVNAYWFYTRYFFSLSLFLVILTAFVSNQLIESFSSQNGKRSLFAVVVVLFVIANLLRPGTKDFFFAEYRKKGYDGIGKWVDRESPAGTVIGCNQTGAIGYFAKDKVVINLDGVVNKEAYDAIKEKRLMEYIKSKKIEYFIDWRINYEFVVRNSAGYREGDLELVKMVDGIKSWDYDWGVYRVRR